MNLGKQLRVRFGAEGPTRAAVEQRLLSRLQIPTARSPAWAGRDQLQALTPVIRIASGVTELPGWDESRILEVAQWGGGLSLLALSKHDDDGEVSAIVREASAFNLAVASFDTIVDEMPRFLPKLASVLHPTLLVARLEGCENSCLTGRIRDERLEAIVKLFDFTLESVSVRLGNNAAERDALGRLLRAMYESEIGVATTPLMAKTLPIVFIGRLSNPRGVPAVSNLFENLARFIADWDDFQDLADDWMRCRANRFLWMPVLSPRFPTTAGLMCGIGRLCFADRATASVRQKLEEALDLVLATAHHGDLLDDAETLLFRLISGRL